MPLTDEQWSKVERRLSSQLGSVKLQCDGHEVFAVVKTDKMKLVIVLYIDGWMKGEWLKDESEMGIKFFSKKTKYLSTQKERASALKQMNNKRLTSDLRAMFKRIYEAKYSYFTPVWTSAKSFCRHIRKTCATIELMEEM
ncbi:MAG: hypothetical protein JNL77_08845 [Nitrosomonas sp.]|nr:hypothetical protein [Nitrosomonas sp.]